MGNRNMHHKRDCDWVIVFDLGGTWFRSGVISNSKELLQVRRNPAINKNTHRMNTKGLQQAMVNYIKNEVLYFKENFPRNIKYVSISIGACINGNTEIVLNSGPLWGENSTPFDILALLRIWEPSLTWTLVNDVTAALLRHAKEPIYQKFTRIALVTISTGIAYRTIDLQRGIIPLTKNSGVQGEIGHLPISFTYREEMIELRCDCGGAKHLNAYCSGRGIETLLPLLAEKYKEEFAISILSSLSSGKVQDLAFEHFILAVDQDDMFALTILDAVTLPLAIMFLHIFTIDAEVEKILLVGGIIHSLRDKYIRSLQKHLHTLGLYQISIHDPDFFQRMY